MQVGYKKQIFLFATLFILILLAAGVWGGLQEWQSCMSYNLYEGNQLLRCLNVSFFGEPQQYTSLLSLSLLLSIAPLFFLKKEVYKTWRIFAAIFIPLAIIIIIASPGSSGGSWALPQNFITREIASVFSAGAFLALSCIIITVSVWRHRGESRPPQNNSRITHPVERDR